MISCSRKLYNAILVKCALRTYFAKLNNKHDYAKLYLLVSCRESNICYKAKSPFPYPFIKTTMPVHNLEVNPIAIPTQYFGFIIISYNDIVK